MGVFPFFVEMEGKTALLAGGGRVALRKAEKLLPFGVEITVVSPEILPELADLPHTVVHRRSFAPSDLDEADFVIAATDDRAVNREISRLCRERGIPVNAVDDRETCTFLFPALVQSGPLTIGISTGGASPAAAAWLRREISSVIPENMDEILEFLERVRPELKKRVADGNTRAEIMSRLLTECLAAGGVPDQNQWEEIIREGEKQP